MSDLKKKTEEYLSRLMSEDTYYESLFEKVQQDFVKQSQELIEIFINKAKLKFAKRKKTLEQ